MFASKCVSGSTDASMLVLGRWSWGIIDSIQEMFFLSLCVQLLEQDGFGTGVLEIPSKHTGTGELLGLMEVLLGVRGQQVPGLGVLTGYVWCLGSRGWRAAVGPHLWE